MHTMLACVLEFDTFCLRICVKLKLFFYELWLIDYKPLLVYRPFFQGMSNITSNLKISFF